MIKNVIFDLGNVLISFKPSEYFEKKNYPEVVRTTILTDIFGSKEWLMLDKGEISTPDAINAISKRSSLRKEEIAHIFNLRTDLLFPLDTNIRILPELRKRGFKLFYLSNFPLDIFEEVKTGYYFFKYFDGGVISAEAKFSKPDRRIYEIITQRYSLLPEECLFIDDLEINVISARAYGMKGLFTNGSLRIQKEVENALRE
jgi:glucose-1-phosphatase